MSNQICIPKIPTNKILDAMCQVGPDTNSRCFDYEDAKRLYQAIVQSLEEN